MLIALLWSGSCFEARGTEPNETQKTTKDSHSIQEKPNLSGLLALHAEGRKSTIQCPCLAHGHPNKHSGRIHNQCKAGTYSALQNTPTPSNGIGSTVYMNCLLLVLYYHAHMH